MSKSQAALGIDVGGSSVKLGIVRPDGEVISRAMVPNDENVSPQSFFAPVVKVASQLITEARAAGFFITTAGCGIPGTFEEGAEFTNLCNVPCLHGFAIRSHSRAMLRKLWDVGLRSPGLPRPLVTGG